MMVNARHPLDAGIQVRTGIWFNVVPGSHAILLTVQYLSYHKDRKMSNDAGRGPFGEFSFPM
jgi:hypothetical protein